MKYTCHDDNEMEMWKEAIPAKYKAAHRIPQYSSNMTDLYHTQQACIRTATQYSTDTARLEQQLKVNIKVKFTVEQATAQRGMEKA
jgi:hypothetical protein